MDKKESMEDYLERILMLSETLEIVRSIDIARFMNFSKASVSIAIKKLVAKGLVLHNEITGEIRLTKEGYDIASKTLDRHKTLSAFFEYLGVEKNQALKDACRVEHDLSENTYTFLKEFIIKTMNNK